MNNYWEAREVFKHGHNDKFLWIYIQAVTVF